MASKSIPSHVIQVKEQRRYKNVCARGSTITFIVICTVNVVLLAVFWTQLLTPAQNKQHPGTSTGSTYGLEDANSPLLGKPAPDFTLPVLTTSSNPATVHLSALKGKSIILNFWASWCGPCNDEAPLLQKSWFGLQAQHLEFIGIDGSERTRDALKFLQQYKISYPNVQDTGNSATALEYGITGLPETIFIDRQGNVVAKWNSPLTEQGLHYEIAKLG